MDYFGYIFSMYSVSVIFGSPIIGYFLTKYPRRSFVQFGLFAMSLAMFGFAICGIFDSKIAFLSIAFITRLIQGFASSTIQTTMFSVSGMMYKDH